MSDMPGHIAKYIARQTRERPCRPDHDITGNLIRNTDGSPFVGPSPDEKLQAARSADYAAHKAHGLLGQWYRMNDPANSPFRNDPEPAPARSGRGGR